MEDESSKILFIGQSKNSNCPYEFADYSVKEPFDDHWKAQCEIKIKMCDGMIALVSNNSINADGEKWEIQKALELGLPVIGVFIDDSTFAKQFPPYNRLSYITWKQGEVARWIEII